MGTNTGARIRQARTGAKLTQAALGEAIGLSAAEISKAERGELQLSQAKLKAIAKATGVTQASLLSGDREATPAPKSEGMFMKVKRLRKNVLSAMLPLPNSSLSPAK